MNIELLIVGNEILIGKTKDTNSNWIAKRVTKHGHKIVRITTISDNLEEIASTLQEVLKRKPEILITSGGLGPTFDDMTLKGIALGLDKELELNQPAYKMIKKSYENAYERGLLKLQGMTKEREKMAYLPEGGTPLPNIRGTAPGVRIKESNTQIFILPGVPTEMKAMFNSSILPILKKEKKNFVEEGFFFSGIVKLWLKMY